MAAVIEKILRDVREPGSSIISPTRFASVMHIEMQALANAAGVHRNTLSGNPGSARLQDRILDILRVVGALSESTGADEPDAIYWIKNRPLREFESKTPLELIAEGKVKSVLHYIESVESGYVG